METIVHTEKSIKELLDRSLPAVIRGLEKIQQATGFKPQHDEAMRKFIAMFARGERLTFKQEKYARSVAKHQAQLLADIANGTHELKEIVPEEASLPEATPIMPSVSADEGAYERYGHPHCRCEDFDGERKCDWCERLEEKAALRAREEEEERRRMDFKFGAGSW